MAQPLRRLFPPYSIMLWWAALLHLYWAVTIWVTPGIVWTTPFGGIYAVCRQRIWAASFLLFIASVGTIALIVIRTPRPWHIVLGGLQQLLLLISAGGVLVAVAQGAYLDGTVMSSAFILADQLTTLLAAFLHSFALYLFHQERYFLQACPFYEG